jgi:hypothetical protein
MKNVILGMLLAGVMGFFFACQKDSLTSNSQALIESISASSQKQPVAIDELPLSVRTYVEQTSSPVEIEAAWHVRKAGYEVALEDGLYLYFNEKGTCLDKSGDRDGGDHAGGNKCLRGDTLTIDSLPQAAVTYLTDSFPGETIQTVVGKKGGKFAVELANGTVLIFDAEGNFLKECGSGSGPSGPHGPHGPHNPHGPGNGGGCIQGDTIDASNLPQAAVDYITGKYANETIQTVVVKASGKFAVELSNGEVLLFDAEGNFLKECGGHNGPGHNGPGLNTPVTFDQLPQAAQDYITAKYPGAAVEKAVQKANGNFMVLLDNHAKLLFDADGNVLFDSGN